MIEEFDRAPRKEKVSKLVSLPPLGIDNVLLSRDLDGGGLDEIKSALRSLRIPISAEDAIHRPFTKSSLKPPYGIGRFGDGSAPVLYTATTVETCVAEIKYHLQRQFSEQLSGSFPFDRYYVVVSCSFEGAALLLCGHEVKYPQLISVDESGYPFCRELASEARADGVQGLVTTSARLAAGICVPIFEKSAAINPETEWRIRFYAESGRLVDEIA